MKIGPLLPKSS